MRGLPPFVYSPFPCRFDEIEPTHLRHLKTAAEGWHVDYKRDVPTADSAGKSLSSFANTYGGWIFYGVDAPGGGSPLPRAFPGIDEVDVARTLEMLQRGAASAVQPTPYYETCILRGPDADTGLSPGRAVIAVRVPPGALPPYIHRTGRIYRRVSDSSEPKPETDRHVLDLLWERSQATRDRWTALIDTDVTLSESEKDRPVAHIFLTCDPYGDRGSRLAMGFDDFVRLMRRSDAGGLPFDNFFTAPGAFIARQVAGNDPYHLTFTWRQWDDGTAMISVPIAYDRIDVGGIVFITQFDGYNHISGFAEVCSNAGLEVSRILDLNFVPYVVYGALLRYRAILDAGDAAGDIHVKVRVDRTWRCVPFLDLAEHTAFVAKHGIPVVQDSSVFAPAGAETMIVLPRNRRAECRDDEENAVVDSLRVLDELSMALGVPLPMEGLLSEMNALLARAKEVQRARGGRR